MANMITEDQLNGLHQLNDLWWDRYFVRKGQNYGDLASITISEAEDRHERRKNTAYTIYNGYPDYHPYSFTEYFREPVAKKEKVIKINVGVVRDHSASMSSLRAAAMRDYNTQVDSFVNVDHRGAVVECGRRQGNWNVCAVVPVQDLKNPVTLADQRLERIDQYATDGGGTPLWDSVAKIIEMLDKYYNKDEAKLVFITTDGYENRSEINARQLMDKIFELQKTDMWTFVFRVPVGNKRSLVQMGIPEGNIIEWDQTEVGYASATAQTTAATQAYVVAVQRGQTSTTKFYTNLESVKPAEIRNVLNDITSEIRSESVWSADNGSQIRDFCMKSFGEFEVDHAYYELMKTEKVQDYKRIIIKHKKKGRYYIGSDARTLLGFPTHGEIKVVPGNHGEYEIYIQSNSVNRKLLTGTKVLYYK